MSQPQYWAVVPAAGAGRRFGSEIPKQYLPLAGSSVIEQTLLRLAAVPAIAGIVVVLSPDDHHFEGLSITLSCPLQRVVGGTERCHSVLNALDHLSAQAATESWVLVHDAARPCLRSDDVGNMIKILTAHPVGGILGVPISDTVKRCDGHGEVLTTVDRTHLWRAQTPQMFRLGMLRGALQTAITAGDLVTDEAAAMERVGATPLMIVGHDDNIKITHKADLLRAEGYLQQQQVNSHL